MREGEVQGGEIRADIMQGLGESAKSSALFFRFQIRFLNVIKMKNRGARVRNGVSGIILV